MKKLRSRAKPAKTVQINAKTHHAMVAAMESFLYNWQELLDDPTATETSFYEAGKAAYAWFSLIQEASACKTATLPTKRLKSQGKATR